MCYGKQRSDVEVTPGGLLICGRQCFPVAQLGMPDWENQLEDGMSSGTTTSSGGLGFGLHNHLKLETLSRLPPLGSSWTGAVPLEVGSFLPWILLKGSGQF